MGKRHFFDFNISGVRQVALRTSIVFGKGKGALVPLARLAKFGLGGKQGSGRQMVSWMHEEDFTNAVNYIIRNKSLSGPINMCAPNPLTNSKMMKAIRDAVAMPIGLPATAWMLEIGAYVIKTETELILKK